MTGSPLPWSYHRKPSETTPGHRDWIEDANGSIVVEHVGHIDGPAICAAVNARTATPQSGGMVKGLEWAKNGSASLWTGELIFGVYYVADEEGDRWRVVRGQFLSEADMTEIAFGSLDTVKAAAQADYEARIRSTLADPIPEAPADEEVEGAGGPSLDFCLAEIVEKAEFMMTGRVSYIQHILKTAKQAQRAALRRSTETDKPGVRAGDWVKLPDWEAEHSERLSPENLSIAGDVLGEYAFGNLSVGYAVSVTVREVGRLIDAARALSASPLTEEQPVPEGWKLVPVEPTVEMQRAANKRVAVTTPDGTWALALDEAATAYRAMLAAAPLPRSTTGGAK